MKEQVSAATLGSYIRGVVIPLVELPRSSTRETQMSGVHLDHWEGRCRVGKMSKITSAGCGRCRRLQVLHGDNSGK